MAECPKCGAELEERLRPGDRCPECGAKRPERGRRDDDEDDDDDRPRRERPKAKAGGAGKTLMILLLCGGLGLVLCCGGGFALFYFHRGQEVEIVDASRHRNAEGGTASVTMNVRVGANRGANLVMGDYVFVATRGTRRTEHRVHLTGQGNGDYRANFSTPELAKEIGPIEVWVEREDRDSSSRVSKSLTIP